MDPIPLPILWDVREYLRQKRDQLTELNELINDEERLKFFEKEQLLVTQQTLKSAI